MAGKDCKINMYAQKHPVRGVYDEKIGAGGLCCGLSRSDFLLPLP